MSTKKKVAILTAGGHAPCLSAAVGQLILHYTQQCPDWEIICYKSGYKGLLLGQSYPVTPEVRAQAAALRNYGGSVIGNSRVKLTNVKDALKRGLIKEGRRPSTSPPSSSRRTASTSSTPSAVTTPTPRPPIS